MRILRRRDKSDTSGETPPATPLPRSRRTYLPPVLIFAVLALGVGAGGYLISRSQSAALRQQSAKQLESIGTLKSTQIASWARERLADARVLQSDAFLAQAAQSWLTLRQPNVQAQLTRALQALPTQYGYADAVLFDAQGHPRLSATPVDVGRDPTIASTVQRTLASGSVTFSDLHLTLGGRPALAWYAPLMVPGRSAPVAVVGLLSDPNTFLYPLIRSWPTSSRSAEALLVRREGDDVLFLNELRFRAHTALLLSLPLSQPDLPAAEAVRGKTGVVEGKDYRGVAVLSDLEPVAGTPWFVVAKMDRSELYAPIVARQRLILVVVIAILAAAGLVLVLLWSARERREARRLFAAERALRELNLTLETRVSERTTQLTAANQELEAFSYSVSHDLRAPLRAMDGFSQALVDDYGDQLDETAHHHLQRVRVAAQRMGTLIDDLLALSQVTRREMEPADVDLSALMHEVVDKALEQEPDRHVEVTIADGVHARADSRLLRIALTNIVDNALKFSRGRATARIEFGEAGDEVGGPVYYVRDNGAGFDLTYVHKLFTPFQRLHRADEFPGTGIGLAIVKRVVVRHGGRVWIEGEIDKGATVRFTLST